MRGTAVGSTRFAIALLCVALATAFVPLETALAALETDLAASEARALVSLAVAAAFAFARAARASLHGFGAMVRRPKTQDNERTMQTRATSQDGNGYDRGSSASTLYNAVATAGLLYAACCQWRRSGRHRDSDA